jgi:hypothetical protein
MSAEGELLRAYHQWRRLVLTETKAIQTRNWPLLSDCHLAIRDYQTLVTTLTQETRAEWRKAGGEVAAREQNLRSLVAELVELTRQNHELLQALTAAARKRLDQIGTAGHHLRQIRRSYGYFPVCSRRV